VVARPLYTWDQIAEPIGREMGSEGEIRYLYHERGDNVERRIEIRRDQRAKHVRDIGGVDD